MSVWFDHPRDCPACGARHSTCTGTGNPLELVLLPQRDGRAAAPASIEAGCVQPTKPGQFSTSSYRRATTRKEPTT